MTSRRRIVILDFGSQYTQLIARRIRECNVFCEILPYTTAPDQVFRDDVAGIIFTGGPSSVYSDDSPHPDPAIFQSPVPILGICYGCQLIGLHLGGSVIRAAEGEYGPIRLDILGTDPLFKGLENESQLMVWMSHGDILERIPDGFRLIAKTDASPIAAIVDPVRRIYGIQFHPEVTHSTRGKEVIRNFVIDICGCRPDWTAGTFIEEAVGAIRTQVGQGKVICGLSGGVDSAVVAMLLDRAIGDQLIAIFINNGILRAGEAAAVEAYFGPRLGARFVSVDASDRSLSKLKGVTDPEKKRKIIGNAFIEVFEIESRRYGRIDFLAQGTLYPDVIESVSVRGPSATIKTHHNVGGLPEKMRLKLVEPLRFLFKDEVRAVGLALGMPEEIVWRQPFPGPGLAVRILGEVTPERIRIVQEADRIVREEIAAAGLMRSLWQVFAVLLPVKTVGVMGDERTYDSVCAIRAVTSTDAMTADWARLPHDLLARMSSRIINEVKGINRVVYDISSKPPATIEWE